MDFNFKCPLCESYFDSQDDLKEHIKAVHTSYYYDTYLVPPVLIFPGESTTVIASETPATVITTEPLVTTTDVLVEPAPVPDDGCCDCCDGCCGGDTAASGADGGDCCGDCDCDCDCVIM